MLLLCVVQHCTECRDCKDQLVHISAGNIGYRMVDMGLTALSCILIILPLLLLTLVFFGLNYWVSPLP